MRVTGGPALSRTSTSAGSADISTVDLVEQEPSQAVKVLRGESLSMRVIRECIGSLRRSCFAISGRAFEAMKYRRDLATTDCRSRSHSGF